MGSGDMKPPISVWSLFAMCQTKTFKTHKMHQILKFQVKTRNHKFWLAKVYSYQIFTHTQPPQEEGEGSSDLMTSRPTTTFQRESVSIPTFTDGKRIEGSLQCSQSSEMSLFSVHLHGSGHPIVRDTLHTDFGHIMASRMFSRFSTMEGTGPAFLLLPWLWKH